MQEEQKQYEKKEQRQEDVPEQDADLEEDNSKETKQEVRVEGECSKLLSLRQRMRALPHHLPLKYRIKDKTIPYRDLLRPGPPPSDIAKKYANRK